MPELTEGGFRVKRLYVLLAGILCIYVFALAGCRSGYKLKEVTPSPDIIIAKDAEFTGVLKDIDDFNDFGVMCAAYWIIKNGNMDYLKCKDELDWETKTSCK